MDPAFLDIVDGGDTRAEDAGRKTLDLWRSVNVPFVVPEG